MLNIEKSISPLIEGMFPAFYKEEGPMFIAFVKAYYEWLESSDQVVYHARRLADYSDIDTTLEEFIVFFKEKYLKNIQFTIDSNKRLFIKHAQEFYRSKGSERAIDLFFRLIYGISAQVYVPGEDVFKLSDNEFVKPLYLEVTKTDKNIQFVGKQIRGASSGATAFVEKLVRKKINGKTIEVFFISNLKKDFQIHEAVVIDDDYDNSPRIIGSLTSFEVIAGGEGFAIGDIVDIDSQTTGAQAKARVTRVEDVTGLVDFTLSDGGWGFSTSANVIVSEKVLVVNNVIISNNSIINPFYLFETVTQPLANISFNVLTGGIFLPQDTVQRYYSNGTLAANVRVLSVSQNTITKTGDLFVSVISGNSETGNTNLYKTGNTVTAKVVTVTDKTVTANVMGVSSNLTLYTDSYTGEFISNEEIYQGNSTTEWANAVLSVTSGSSANLVVNVNQSSGVFRTSQRIYGRTSGASANLKSFGLNIGVCDINNAFVSDTGNYIVGSNSETTANISIIGEGSLAGFSIANLAFEEVVTLNSDILSSRNFANVSFMNTSFIIDGSSGTGLSANAYGFLKFPTGNINSTILECLTIETKTVGTITDITSINKGTNYTLDPFVLIYEPSVAAQKANDYIFTIENSTGNFANGELIEQSIVTSNVNVLQVSNVTTGNVEVLTISNVDGMFSIGETIYQSNGTSNVGYGVLQTVNSTTMVVNSVSNSFNTTYSIEGASSLANASVSSIDYLFFQLNERINQSNGTANIASGIIKSVNINSSSNTGTITVVQASADFVISNSSSLQIIGTLSSANAKVDSVNTSNVSVLTKGLIEYIPDANTLGVKRLSLANFFEVTPTSTITGVSSGVTANLVGITYSNDIAGRNAVVLTDVVAGNGYITGLDLVDSGFGYSNGDVLEFTSEDGLRSGTTKLILQKQGSGEGYFKNSKGLLSDGTHLFDGKFYQEYSYQIISKLPFEKYSDMFKRVLHIAGTEVFGKVSIEENANAQIAVANSSITLS